MKKFGFTLAEVLITLTIIGVVAAITMPALMSNAAEQQAKTAFKKGINTLTEAAQVSLANDNVGYADLLDASNVTDHDEKGQDKLTLWGLLNKNTSVDYDKTGAGSANAPFAPNSDGNNYVVTFRDGSYLSFNKGSKSDAKTGSASEIPNKVQDDGLPYGITALYDTNGSKGPNLVSNCSGNAAMKAGSASDNTLDWKVACTNTKRVIKDQFGVRLRGGIAVPNGAAARWAWAN